MIRKVAFTMYPVTDVARARKFYEETLGLAVGKVGGRGDMWWIEYDLPGGGCIALTTTTGGKPAFNTGTIALEVDDIDALTARLKAAGAEIMGAIVHGPHCRMQMIKDSEGNGLLLHQLNTKAA